MRTLVKIFKFIILTTLIVFVVVWIGTLLKYDISTALYGEEFKDTYKQSTMLGKTDYLKVMKYSSNYAEVYCIDENKLGGDILYCKRNDKRWELIGYHTVWSDFGSASDVIFPYWWHFIYGGL